MCLSSDSLDTRCYAALITSAKLPFLQKPLPGRHRGQDFLLAGSSTQSFESAMLGVLATPEPSLSGRVLRLSLIGCMRLGLWSGYAYGLVLVPHTHVHSSQYHLNFTPFVKWQKELDFCWLCNLSLCSAFFRLVGLWATKKKGHPLRASLFCV